MRAPLVIALWLTVACTGRDGFDRILATSGTCVGAACAPACGTLASLGDDFDDGTLGQEWQVSPTGLTVAESGGVLELRPALSGTSGSCASDEAFAPDGSVTMEVREMVDTTTDATFNLYMIDYRVGGVGMYQQHGFLTVWASSTVSGSSTPTSVPYDPAVQRWWRLTLNQQTFAAETSPDGVSWTVVANIALPFSFDRVHVGLSIDTAGTPSPGHVVVDNLNAPGTGAFSNCPIDGLADDFSGSALDVRWEKSFSQNGSTIGESGGNLVITPVVNGVGGAGLFSTNHYDLRGRSITARVPQILSDVFGAESYFRVFDSDSSAHNAYFVVRNSAIEANVDSKGLITNEPYDPTLHRCWRFREANGLLYWEAAGDPCTSFRVMARTNPGFSLGSVSLIIFGQAFTPLADPGTFRIDRLSVP